MRGKPWPAELEAELRQRWADGQRPVQIRREMELTPGQLAGRVRVYQLHTPPKRSRFHDPMNPAVIEGRTRFPTRVTDQGEPLKHGDNSQKLGGMVTKGRWKGSPIYALNLEERKTCPVTCKVWASCYGDNMHWAKRMKHGPALLDAIWVQLGKLQREHPFGFAVRLHTLGDFYDVGYVAFWAKASRAFPGLRVFGYTAWQADTPIGAAIVGLRDRKWSRFAVRTSGAAAGPRTMVIPPGKRAPAGVVLCPAQSEKLAQRGKQISCGSCALCWNSKRPIGFLQH